MPRRKTLKESTFYPRGEKKVERVHPSIRRFATEHMTQKMHVNNDFVPLSLEQRAQRDRCVSGWDNIDDKAYFNASILLEIDDDDFFHA